MTALDIQKKRILIVDDKATIVSFCSRVLGKENFEIDNARETLNKSADMR